MVRYVRLLPGACSAVWFGTVQCSERWCVEQP